MLGSREYHLRHGREPPEGPHEFSVQLSERHECGPAAHADGAARWVYARFPKSLLRQHEKAHYGCVRGLPHPVQAGSSLFELRAKNKQPLCMDMEYLDYVFEGEATPCLDHQGRVTHRYQSTRLIKDSKGNYLLPSPKHGLFRNAKKHICCAYCTRKMSQKELNGQAELPVCAKRRFGWRCSPEGNRPDAPLGWGSPLW